MIALVDIMEQLTLVVLQALDRVDPDPERDRPTCYADTTITAYGGDKVYNAPLKGWSVSVGALPAGLQLDATTGRITGTPTGPVGRATFKVTCSDSCGPPQYSDPRELFIDIG